jgi:hypothetical protein
MFPEMFGYENTLFGPKGKAHEGFGKSKRKFCGDQRPDARDPGVWSWSPRRTLAFRVKPTLRRFFTPSFDPKAQHINRGAGLAPETHQD